MVNMNQPDSDGVDDFVEQQVRLGMSVLGQAGMVVMRAHEHAQRRQEQQDQAAAEQSRERLDAERGAAHAILDQTRQPGWWEQATAQEVGRTYAVADAWAQAGDPVARWSRESMESQIQVRYGLTPEALQAMANEVERERDRDRGDADRSERQAGADRVNAGTEPDPDRAPESSEQPRRVPPWEDEPEVTPAEQPHRQEEGEDLAVANLADVAEEAHRDHAYDSAERREAFAERMRSEGVDDQLVVDRLRSDMSQGQPPGEAVKTSRVASARTARGRGAARVREVARDR